MGGVIEAVGDELHCVDVGSGPDDVEVGPVGGAGVKDDGAVLTLEPQLLAKNVGGALPLVSRHSLGVLGGGTDLRVIKAIPPMLRSLREGLPVAKGLHEVCRALLTSSVFACHPGRSQLQQLGSLAVVVAADAHEVDGELSGAGPGCALGDHGSAPAVFPSASKMAVRISTYARSASSSSGRLGLSPELMARAIWLMLLPMRPTWPRSSRSA